MPSVAIGSARPTRLVCGAIVLCVIALYVHVVECGFVNLDDGSHIYKNSLVLSGLRWEQLKGAFAPHASLWIPLTWVSFMAEVSVFGVNAVEMHVLNVLLHAANAVLLFLLLKRMTQRFWPSAAVAALFAIHPINVESVAWVTERKNVLCFFFGLLSLHAYTTYARRASKPAYLAALTCFGLALLAKPMLVPLPAGLLLLDIWPFGRLDWTNWRRRALEKLPFLLLAVGSCLMTMRATATVNSAVTFDFMPFQVRVSNALIAYATYLSQMAWPSDLCVLYPHKQEVELLKAGISFLTLTIITVTAWRLRRPYPYLLIGWLWFLGMLVPMIGFVQVGPQSHADRFTYVAQLGIFVAGVWLIADLWGDRPRRWLVYSAMVVGVGLTLATLQQVEHWTNGVTLFERAVAVTTGNHRAYHHAAVARAQVGDFPAAINHFKQSLRIYPYRAETWNYLSAALIDVGHNADAEFAARKAIALQPDYPEARLNLASACEAIGHDSEAIAEYRRILEGQPDTVAAHYRLGLLLAKQGEIDAARQSLMEAARLVPEDATVAQALREFSATAVQ